MAKKTRDRRVEFINNLKKNKISDFEAKGMFKYEFDTKVREYVYAKLPVKFQNLVYSTPFPFSYISICENSPIISSKPYISQELIWCFDLLIQFNKRINQYITLRREFEIFIINGQIEQAWTKLEELENAISVSYYGLLSEFYINTLTGESEINKDIINEFFAADKINMKFLVVSEMGRIRIEKNISAWQYDSQVQQHIIQYGNDELDAVEYLRFKLDPINFEGINRQYVFVLNYDSDFALIDRYDTLKKNLPAILQYPKKDSGLKLLKEISRRREISKPESIIGLTQYEEIHDSAKSIFDNEGWTVIKYDPKLADWEDAIKNKIYWLIEKNTMEKTLKERTKILFIASSPNDQSILNAGMEQRLIEEALQLSTQRDTFEISFKHGAKLATLTRELMQFEPQILHFTGHGDISGIAMEEDNGSTILVPNSSLERLFKLFKGKINCVILSSCYSSNQAEIISQQNMYVIGMNDTVGVVAATEFSKGFYQALGEGKSVYDSFNFGLVHLTTSDENQQDIPEIWFDGVKM